ncbi:MAG: sarcosine oxidase subunit gamma [Paracoccaceae bacterium]
MVKLIPTDPFDGALPLTVGEATLSAFDPGPMGLVTGGDTQPPPNRVLSGDGWRAISVAPDQALRMGDRSEGAIDLSDGLVVAHLTGTDAAEVLARLVPVDVAALPADGTARTLLGHLTVSIQPTAGGFEIVSPRSSAGTLVHDLTRAMDHVAGRRAL